MRGGERKVQLLEHDYQDFCIAYLFKHNDLLKQALHRPAYQALRAALIRLALLTEDDLTTVGEETYSHDDSMLFSPEWTGNTASEDTSSKNTI